MEKVRRLPIQDNLFRTALETSVASLIQQPGIVGILLFGSVARGDATPTSDIDLLVVREHEQFHVQVEPIAGISVKMVVLPGEGLEGSVTPEIQKGLRPTFADGQILFDPAGVLADLCDKMGRAIRNGPPSLPEEEFDHIRVSLTELLAEVHHSLDLPTARLLAYNLLTTSIKCYYQIQRWWLPPLKRQMDDLEQRDCDLASIGKDILSSESKGQIRDSCDQLVDYVLRDIGGRVVYEKGKKYYI